MADDPPGGTIIRGQDVLRGLTFANDGSLLSQPAGTIAATFTVGGGSSFTIDTSGMTGYQGDAVADATDSTGYGSDLLQAVSVSNTGVVQGIYSNGKTVAMSATGHQLGLVTFINPAGLIALDLNRWQVSNNSGDPVAVVAGDAGTNLITAGALEGSNVDLSTEFTRLIISQRAFQSNSKAFQTADAILQEANGLIR